jgi:hypothetical protein
MPTHKNWHRYSLRNVMLLVTFVCLWLGRQTYLDNQQAEALDRLRQLGGHAQTDSTQSSLLTKLSGSKDTISGSDVTDINFLGPKTNDAEIEEIVRLVTLLPNLERITFTDTALTFAGEQKIQAALPNLEIQAIMTTLGPRATTFNR